MLTPLTRKEISVFLQIPEVTVESLWRSGKLQRNHTCYQRDLMELANTTMADLLLFYLEKRRPDLNLDQTKAEYWVDFACAIWNFCVETEGNIDRFEGELEEASSHSANSFDNEITKRINVAILDFIENICAIIRRSDMCRSVPIGSHIEARHNSIPKSFGSSLSTPYPDNELRPLHILEVVRQNN